MKDKISRGFIIQEKYETIKQLGAGLYTSVYLVRSIKDNGLFALKVYKGPYENNKIFQRRFEREFELARQFSHPNLVKYITSGVLDGSPYIIMDYIDGKTVGDLITYHKRVPVGIALRIFGEALSGLALLHKNEIVHRDIKPSAIFVDYQGNVKLVDFDITKKIDDDEQLTGKGLPIGSQLYMAPEQRLGERVDSRADVFAAGVTFYEMITGKNPWENNDFLSTDRRSWKKPIPASKLAKDANSDIDKLIENAIVLHPTYRFASAEKMLEAVKKFRWATKDDLIQWTKGRKISDSDIKSAQPGNYKKRVLIILGTIAIALILFGIVWVLYSSNIGNPPIIPTVTPTFTPTGTPTFTPAP